MSEPAPDENREAPRWRRLGLPVLGFALMLAWSNIPPYRSHVEHEPRALFSWSWHLYYQGGREVCEVRYFDMNLGGAPIERWALYGYDRPGEVPDKLARIRINGLEADYRRVCTKLREAGDPAPNVEVLARCGVDPGWKYVAKRKANICDPDRKRRTVKRNYEKPKTKQAEK